MPDVMRSFIPAVALLAALSLAHAIAQSPPARSPPVATVSPLCLHGTFVQLLETHGKWTEEEWRRLFGYFRRLQLRRLVVQWSAYGDIAFYPSGRLDSVPNSPLETLLRMSDAAGIRVLIGLSHDPDYGARMEQPDRHRYLAQRLGESLAIAREIAPLAAQHASFAGWYISDEVDAAEWQDSDAREALATYLAQLSNALRALSGDRAIGISGYAQRQTTPERVGELWAGILDRAGAITHLYFQDGIGVHNLDLGNLPSYYGAIDAVAQARNREFHPVMEIFSQTGGEPVSEGEFKAVPAPLARIMRQARIASQYSDQWIAFSVPEYLTPAGGQAAKRQYHVYLDAMRKTRTKCSPATDN